MRLVYLAVYSLSVCPLQLPWRVLGYNLFVFDAVDDRIDAAIEKHHDHGEVVERTGEVN